MNRIDKKYKESLGERSFPRSMKEKGWSNLQGSLDSEFPGSPASSSPGVWKYGLGVMAAGITIGALYLMLFSEKAPTENLTHYEPRAEEVKNIPESGQEEITFEEVQKLVRQGAENISYQELQALKSVENNTTSTSGIIAAGDHLPEKSNTSSGSVKTAEEPQAISFNEEKAAHNENPPVEDHPTEDIRTEDITPEEVAQGEPMDAGQSVSEETLDISSVVVKEADVKETPETGAVEENKQKELSAEDFFAEMEAEDVEEEAPLEKVVLEEEGEAENFTSKDASATSESSSGEENTSSQSEDVALAEELNSPSEAPDRETPVQETVIAEDQREMDAPVADTLATPALEKTAGTKIEDWHLAFPKAEDEEEFKLPTLAGRRFALSVYGGYSHVDKLLKSENPAHLAKRRQEEAPVWTTPTGIGIDYFLNSRFTFSMGIGYAEYGEMLDYQVRHIDTAFADGRYTNPRSFPNIIAMDSIRIVDSIYVGHWNYNVIYETEDTAVAANNGRTSITYIEIPLTVGYRFGTGRVKPWLQSGISLGIPVATSYRYLNTRADGLESQGQLTDVVPLQWNYQLSLGVDCRITRHWSLRLQGLGSLQINSMLRNTEVEQRYYRLGGRLAIAYNF